MRSNVGHSHVVLLVLALLLLGGVANRGASQPIAPLRDPPALLRDASIEKLIASVGDEYEEARDLVLAIPSEDREFLLATLRSYGSRSRGAMVATFIEVRAKFPELSAEFDRRLAEQVDRPLIGGVTPKTIYRAWLPEEVHIDPLVIEAIVLRSSLPDGLRGSLAGRLGHRSNPALIELLMGAADQGWPGAVNYIAGQCCEAREHHARVAEFLNDFYRRSRESGQLSLIGVPSSLLQLGGPPRLAEVRSLIALERDLMPAQGFKPWEDEGLSEQLVELRLRRESVERELATERESGTDGRRVARLESEMAAIDTELERVRQRREARSLWQTLLRVETQLAMEVERGAADASP